jgi:hypothetical protein
MKTLSLSIAAGAISLAGAADAASVPAGLFNKTITTSFTVAIPAKGADGSTLTAQRNITKTMYVSSAGRIFARNFRTNGKNVQDVEAGPERTGASFHFDGANLVGTIPIGNGASQLIISFGSGFQSCTAQAVLGREGGRTFIWKGLNGIMYTATGAASVSSPSCSIQSGNAFAGQ